MAGVYTSGALMTSASARGAVEGRRAPPAMLQNLPDSVSVYEVSPRDGLQNERATVPLRSKLRLIDALVLAGLKRIEITSFVSPKWIPQLADADEVGRHAKPPPGVAFSALCPNGRG